MMPQLEVLGFDVLRSLQTGCGAPRISDLLSERPALELVSMLGQSLWCIPSLEDSASCGDLLVTLKRRFPQNRSLCVDYVAPKGCALRSVLKRAIRTAENPILWLLEQQVDTAARLRFSTRAIKISSLPSKGTVGSPAMFAVLMRSGQAVRSLWPAYLETAEQRTAQEWIADEPIHPLVAVCRLGIKEILLSLLRPGWNWDWFAPVGDDHTPLIIECLKHLQADAPAQCFFDWIKANSLQTRLAQLLYEWNCHDHGDTTLFLPWVHYLFSRGPKLSIVRGILCLPRFDRHLVDIHGFEPLEWFLRGYDSDTPLRVPGEFDLRPELYLKSLESSDRSVRTLSLLRGQISVPKNFADQVRTALGRKSPTALFEFLRDRAAMLLGPEQWAPLLSHHNLTREQLEQVARSSLGKLRETAPLQELFAAGCSWLASEEALRLLLIQFTPFALAPLTKKMMVIATPSHGNVNAEAVFALTDSSLVHRALFLLVKHPFYDIAADTSLLSILSQLFSHIMYYPPVGEEGEMAKALLELWVDSSSLCDNNFTLRNAFMLGVDPSRLGRLASFSPVGSVGYLWDAFLCPPLVGRGRQQLSMEYRAAVAQVVAPFFEYHSPNYEYADAVSLRLFLNRFMKEPSFWFYNQTDSLQKHFSCLKEIDWAIAGPAQTDPLQLLWRQLLRWPALTPSEKRNPSEVDESVPTPLPSSAELWLLGVSVFQSVDRLHAVLRNFLETGFGIWPVLHTWVKNGYLGVLANSGKILRELSPSQLWHAILASSHGFASEFSALEHDVLAKVTLPRRYPIYMSLAEALADDSTPFSVTPPLRPRLP